MIRCRVPELMDRPDIDPAAHEHALRSLNRIEWVMQVHRKLYRHLEMLGDPRQMSVVDLGAGGGGFLGYVARRGVTSAGKDSHGPGCGNGFPHQQRCRLGPAGQPLLVGVDCSHFAMIRARVWQRPVVQGVVADARRVPLVDGSVDVATCSLFLHHFDETDVVAILREAARVARLGVVVGDLSRSRVALAMTWIATRLVSRSRVFHVDGPRSVRAAFRAGELADLAERAGLAQTRVKRMFPFRLVLTWRKR